MYTIEDLKDGKCAVRNDGTLEELQQVLDKAFPGHKMFGNCKFYKKDPYDCVGCKHTDLPIQSVKDFLIDENYVVFTGEYEPGMTSKWNKNIIGEIFKIERKKWNGYQVFVPDHLNNYFTFELVTNYFGNFRFATKKEVETFKQKEMKNSIIFTPDQQRQVYEMACAEWKEKIKQEFSDSLFKDINCEISKETFKQWIKASTTSQIEVFKNMQPDYFKEVTYTIGSKFEYNDNTYMLIYPGIRNKMLLINTKAGTRFNNPFSVANIDKVTENELKEMVGNRNFLPIK